MKVECWLGAFAISLLLAIGHVYLHCYGLWNQDVPALTAISQNTRYLNDFSQNSTLNALPRVSLIACANLPAAKYKDNPSLGHTEKLVWSQFPARPSQNGADCNLFKIHFIMSTSLLASTHARPSIAIKYTVVFEQHFGLGPSSGSIEFWWIKSSPYNL